MRYTLNNGAGSEATEVLFGPEALEGLAAATGGYTKIALIADENSARFCLETIKPSLDITETIILPAGEDNKNLASTEDILRRLREAGLDRGSLIVGLGGGVISDIAGFAASTYMRGIGWIMLPTTLIAQADASIGAKTGVNLDGYKNMMGSFWPPKAVLIYPGFLKTLPKRQLNNGLAEVIKMGFICDKNILDHVGRIDPEDILGGELEKACDLAIRAKIDIVNEDMLEAGERKLLNFGHSVGHALESLALEGDNPLLHGEAISVGMVAETRLAGLEGVCEPQLADQVKSTLERFGLPGAYSGAALEGVLERISSDKKNVGENIYWTLPKAAGEGIFNHIAKPENIDQAISSVLD